MTRRPPVDLGASVRARLLRVARERGEEPERLLVRYALERFLYRLGESPVRDRFVLKGAMLFAAWVAFPGRLTRDINLLGHGDSSPEAVAGAIREVIETPVDPDGLRLDVASLTAEPIREDQEYGGVRCLARGDIGGALVRLQVDVGFGDAVTPGIVQVVYPTLLDFPAPRVQGYPPETVVAEKFEVIARLGIANTRVKDFFDLWTIAHTFEFRGEALSEAIAATFRRRGTNVPATVPTGLGPEFVNDPAKRAQWAAFLDRTAAGSNVGFPAVAADLRLFLMPVAVALASGMRFKQQWVPGGPWHAAPGLGEGG